MTTLELERRPVLPQNNGGAEVQQIVVFQERRAGGNGAETVWKRVNVIAEARQNGWYKYITIKQQLALGRYLMVDDNGRIPSLEAWRIRLKNKGIIDVTRQALHDTERKGFCRLERICNKEKEQEKEQEKLRKQITDLYEVQQLSKVETARMLRMSKRRLNKLVRSFGIQSRKEGPLPKMVIDS